MAEAEATARRPDAVYSRLDLLADLRQSLWSELAQRRVLVDHYRRELQHAHLTLLLNPLKALPSGKLTAVDAQRRILAQSSAYHLMLAEVRMLGSEITRAIPRVADAATSSHLELLKNLADCVCVGETH